MKFVLFDDVRQDVVRSPGFVEYPSFVESGTAYQLVLKLEEKHSIGAQKLLNEINNQGIQEINFNGYFYVVGGKKIPLVYLSTGERIFLLGYVAEVTGVELFLYHGIRQLSKSSMAKFFERFGGLDNITILCDNIEEIEMYSEKVGV